jgi:hypothetical protein
MPTRIALAINQKTEHYLQMPQRESEMFESFLDVIKSLFERSAKREVYLFSLAAGEAAKSRLSVNATKYSNNNSTA